MVMARRALHSAKKSAVKNSLFLEIIISLDMPNHTYMLFMSFCGKHYVLNTDAKYR